LDHRVHQSGNHEDHIYTIEYSDATTGEKIRREFNLGFFAGTVLAPKVGDRIPLRLPTTSALVPVPEVNTWYGLYSWSSLFAIITVLGFLMPIRGE
ncbi:MAG: hypothetical protein ABEN55_23445, partial [Bradymonadaceae bacterium]